MKTRKRVRYYVTHEGFYGSFAAEGYSKYYNRRSAKADGRLRGEVYGIAQCRDHIRELRKSVYAGRKTYADVTFVIVREETNETVVQTIKP